MIQIVFATFWSICAFSRPVILIDNNYAVDVKVPWTVEFLVIKTTGSVSLAEYIIYMYTCAHTLQTRWRPSLVTYGP